MDIPVIVGERLDASSEHNRYGWASDLGFAPGHWPETVVVIGKNGTPFQFSKVNVARDREGDVQTVTYTFGPFSIVVYND